jgi:hypothetical protein
MSFPHPSAPNQDVAHIPVARDVTRSTGDSKPEVAEGNSAAIES